MNAEGKMKYIYMALIVILSVAFLSNGGAVYASADDPKAQTPWMFWPPAPKPQTPWLFWPPAPTNTTPEIVKSTPTPPLILERNPNITHSVPRPFASKSLANP